MKKTKSFYASVIFSLLILVIPVVHFIYHKTNGHLVEINNIITDTSLVAFALSILFVLIKKIPNTVKMVITVVILCATSFLCYWLNGVGGYTVFESYNGIEEVESYNEVFEDDYPFRYEDIYKSELDIISYGDFEDIAHYYYLSTGLFQQSATTTIVKYDNKNFEKQVKRINGKITFYEKAVIENDAVPVFSYEGFDFRLEKSEYGDEWYPKDMRFVGINEETKEIAFVDFQDYDLDIVMDFENNLHYDCGWHLIIKDRNNKA